VEANRQADEARNSLSDKAAAAEQARKDATAASVAVDTLQQELAQAKTEVSMMERTSN